MKRAIYLAGPLFTVAERDFNLELAKALGALGHEVVLPQEEAYRYEVNGVFDFPALTQNCLEQALECETVVAILDGSDADSGTSMEVGIKVAQKRLMGKKQGQVIGVRTDFRGSEDNGLNAMFRLLDNILYLPSYENSVGSIASAIYDAIWDLRK